MPLYIVRFADKSTKIAQAKTVKDLAELMRKTPGAVGYRRLREKDIKHMQMHTDTK